MMLEKMVAWEEALVQEQHHRRLREEASRRHQLGLVPRRERVSLQPVLARVGKRLVKWGCRLQARYGTLADVSNTLGYVRLFHQHVLASSVGSGAPSCSCEK